MRTAQKNSRRVFCCICAFRLHLYLEKANTVETLTTSKKEVF